jgi:hypothetical protein
MLDLKGLHEKWLGLTPGKENIQNEWEKPTGRWGATLSFVEKKLYLFGGFHSRLRTS